MTDKATGVGPDEACVAVTPGICGFTCRIRARKIDKRMVSIDITDSECKQIQMLAGRLAEMSLKALFMPMTRNPVYVAAEKSGCHPSCAIPSAVLKTVEVAMGMALPQDVRFRFDNEGKC
jgi:hypothetical protein